MIAPVLLADWLKSLQTATSVSGLSTLLLTSAGELVKKAASSFVMLNGTVTDLNNATTFGFWSVGANALNIPPGLTANTSDKACYFGSSSDYGAQAYIPLFIRNGIFFRTKVNESWSKWWKITLVEMT